jgi:hypothetical protein
MLEGHTLGRTGMLRGSLGATAAAPQGLALSRGGHRMRMRRFRYENRIMSLMLSVLVIIVSINVASARHDENGCGPDG